MTQEHSLFTSQPSRWSWIGLTAAVFLTCLNLGVTLRFLAERSLIEQSELTFNWTIMACFGSGLLLTPLAISLPNGVPGLKTSVRRTLVALNVIPFLTLVLPLLATAQL